MICIFKYGKNIFSYRTIYIEYRSLMKIFMIFLRLVFCFFYRFPRPVGGIPPKKLVFLIQYKEKLIITGDLFFIEIF